MGPSTRALEPRIHVRRLEPADREMLARFALRAPAENLFHLANLEQLGMDYPGLRYYGAFAREEEALVGELMLFGHNGGLYWEDPAVLPFFADLVLSEQTYILNGTPSSIVPLLRLLPAGAMQDKMAATQAVVTAETLREWAPCGERLATRDDLDRLTVLYAHNLLLATQSAAEHRSRLERLFDTGGMLALVERDGLAVSAARVSAFGYGMAMVGGVVTLPAYRRQGFARACTGLLSTCLIARGMTPYLVYNVEDPAAARTYASLGYTPIGDWLVLFLDPFARFGSAPASDVSSRA